MDREKHEADQSLVKQSGTWTHSLALFKKKYESSTSLVIRLNNYQACFIL